MTALGVPSVSVADAGNTALQSLSTVFSSIPDPRRRNRRHKLGALLCGLVAGFCAGCNAMCHVTTFLRQHQALRSDLGFTHPISPSQSTYTRTLAKVDAGEVIKATRNWLHALARQRLDARRHGAVGVAVDGKTACGTGEHTVYLFIQEFWLLIDLFETSEKSNEHKELEERIDDIIKRHPFLSIFTMDALYAQHALAQGLTGQGRRAIFQIKENQRDTHRRMKRFFALLPHESPHVQGEEKKWGLHRAAAVVGQARAC